MGERRLGWLAAGLAVLTVSIVQAQTLLHVLHAEQRLRERIRLETLADVSRALGPLRDALEQRGPADWERALQEARRSARASELELFDEQGQPMAADPLPSPVEHWPPPEELARAADSIQAYGPLGEPQPRLFHYAGVRVRGRPLLLRFATDAPELVESRRERRQLLVAHGVALVVLLLAALLALLPRGAHRREGIEALGAYEEAMSRLQSRGSQRQAELERLGAELRDKAALARSGELAGGIAHEMRNGLGTILTHARLLEAAGAGPEVAEAAAAIRAECDTLASVVRRFVDFVREERLEVAELDLAATLRRVAARERRGHDATALEMSLPPSLPLAGDEDLLERAFENLVRNALEAAGPGGRVGVSAEPGADAVRVCVDDDGPGLAAGSEPLRPFSTSKAGGIGLGLPLALKIVHLHGGALDLRPRHPRGVRVEVWLPRAARDRSVTTGNTAVADVAPAASGSNRSSD